jgi:hypothetical protein
LTDSQEYFRSYFFGQPHGIRHGQHVLLASVKLQNRHDQITRIKEFPRFKELVNYAKRSVLVAGLGSVIIWMSFEFSYRRLDRNVWKRVPRSTENQRVFVHESCSNFFLSSSAFALKESSSAGVKNRISGRITSLTFDDSLRGESIQVKTYASNLLAARFASRRIFLFWRFIHWR